MVHDGEHCYDQYITFMNVYQHVLLHVIGLHSVFMCSVACNLVVWCLSVVPLHVI